MRKKEIIAILMLYVGGVVVGIDNNYNTQSETVSCKCLKIDSPTEKIEKLSKEYEEYKRQEYIENKVNELREQKRIEEERKRQEELRRQQEEQLNNIGIYNRGRDIDSIRVEEAIFEISYYCSCELCCTGATGITASGKPVQDNLTIALPKEYPFGTKVKIDGDPIIYENMDTGSFIESYINNDGVKVIRCDIYVSSHSEALEKGRQIKKGWLIYEN